MWAQAGGGGCVGEDGSPPSCPVGLEWGKVKVGEAPSAQDGALDSSAFRPGRTYRLLPAKAPWHDRDWHVAPTKWRGLDPVWSTGRGWKTPLSGLGVVAVWGPV